VAGVTCSEGFLVIRCYVYVCNDTSVKLAPTVCGSCGCGRMRIIP